MTRKHKSKKRDDKHKKHKSVRKTQKKVYKKYKKDFKWRPEKVQNHCKNDSFKLHKTQKFLQEYYTPLKKEKGIILYHSVGSGKTCAAIAIAARFEDFGYSILWVTRNSIKNVVYQNLFGEHICHPKINSEKLGDNPHKRFGHFNKVTNKAWFKPVSYRSFSNISKKKSKLYRELVKRNGERDPLHKTLVIIDEAHNFTTLKPMGFSKHESAKFEDVQNMIYKSYTKSQKDSVRILMLTATPGLNGIIGAINMLNLLITKETERMSTESGLFIHKFINKENSGFSQEGRNIFGKNTRRFVSFLDTTKDYTRFAKKIYETFHDPLSRDRLKLKSKLNRIRNESVSDHCKISFVWKEVNEIINMPGIDTKIKVELINKKFSDSLPAADIRPLLIDTKKLFKDCRDRYKNNKELINSCITHVKKNKDDATLKMKNTIKHEVDKCRMTFKMDKKNKVEEIKKKLDQRKLVIENNQEDALLKCDNLPNKEHIKCVKKVLMWNDTMKQTYKFEHGKFNPDQLNTVLPIVSTKFKKLLDKIKELDTKDKCVHKRTYKHVIYVDDQKFVKLLMSIMMANKFNLIFNQIEKKRMRKGKSTTYKSLGLQFRKEDEKIRKNQNKNFGVLTKAVIYKRHIGKNFATKIKDSFNERNEKSRRFGKDDNVYGQKNFRFLIIDNNFLEGVSLFDAKYLHILTEPKTDFQFDQLVGRVVRRCGHKGLPLDKNEGWRINILTYNSHDRNKTNYDKYLQDFENDKRDDEDAGFNKIQQIIVNEMQENAFDKKLTEKIHKNFKQLFENI